MFTLFIIAFKLAAIFAFGVFVWAMVSQLWKKIKEMFRNML
ncbi:hypothetical protein [Bacillus cereus]|nr:hypothetical protein [Bacillus cereus]